MIGEKMQEENGVNFFSAEYTANQTNLDIITPSSGKMVCVRYLNISSDSVAGEIHLDFPTSGIKVERLYLANTARSSSPNIDICGGIDEPLRLNSTQGAKDLFISINYYEE